MTDKFYHPRIQETGWHKDLPVIKRRKKILKGYKGNILATARSLEALANVSRDKATAKAALVDARYFYNLYRSKGK